MAKVINEPIADLNVSWENYSGERVEEFIKSQLKNKCGFIYRTPQKIGNYYYMYGFYDQNAFMEWQDTMDNELILFRCQLPNIENDVFSCTLATNSNTQKLVNLGDGIIVGLRYESVSTNPTTHVVSDTYNDGILYIMRSANGSPWMEVGKMTISPIEHEKEGFQNIDLTQYLADGDNRIRLRVEDNVNGSVSNNVNFNSIVNTTLAIETATSTAAPLNELAFEYYIQGQVAKTLNVKITDDEKTKQFSVAIGDKTYIETTYQLLINDNTINSGIIQVESWLSVDDTTLESEHVRNQFYYAQGGADKAIVILNNVNKTVSNYTTTKLFDFNIYNKMSDVVISVMVDTETILNYTFYNCAPGITYTFNNTLELESEATNVQAVYVVKTSDMTATEAFTIDNSVNFNPTAGADFVLSPRMHNNSEAKPDKIVNEATKTEVKSTFNNFAFVNDGYVNDENNIPVLRIPAGRSLNIEYDPLDTLIDGTTIEIDYKVYNIFNAEEEMIRIGSELANGNILGFTMSAQEGTFMTLENQTLRDQDFHFGEGSRIHLAINILPNVSNSGLNYVRLFLNGTINREFLYKMTDTFHGTDPVSIQIGGNDNDIDIFGIRIYKKGLSASDVRQDYMSSIPTIEEKIAYKSANDILSSDGTISFDKASVKYNTLIWTGRHPEYTTGNVKFDGDLTINILGDPAHSGTINNLKIKGQGSSSRGYWKWNHQYDFQENSVWIDGNGEVRGAFYSVQEGTPNATCLVGKRNWASSPQSHKIGATALYNDLWKAIVGGNGISKTEGFETVRNAVVERPFLYFIKETPESQPVFDGFMTFGSGKGDIPTFIGDEAAFPDYLMLEGSDNGIPLATFQVPWIEEDVTYDETDEFYKYAGQGAWDYGGGNFDMLHYFISAFNFIYQHSTRLIAFNGDLNALNAKAETEIDKTYHYWNISNGDVYRYDYITKKWVDAGLEKIAEGEYSKLNIVTQTGISITADVNDIHEQFLQWRRDDFKKNLANYYNVNDLLYSVSFVKMIAASDNWCKNTYHYLDPVTHKLCMMQDDLDTIFRTDNVGRNTKPYYIEERDRKSDGSYYFNGEDSVFFNLILETYDTELRAMLKTIFDTMATTEFGGSTDACMEKYFFYVQKYFPSVAYNETARLLYEQASQAQAAGQYTNGTPAISQSLGDQLTSEQDWWNRRSIYLKSYAASDPFAARSQQALGFRSVITASGTRPTYQFEVEPWIYLYPKVGTGQSLGTDNTRVPARTKYTTSSLSTDGNTDTFIYGADYYTDFGEFGGISLSEEFILTGAHLLRFSADSRNVAQYNFAPKTMKVTCPALRELIIYGAKSLTGSLDLGSCPKLQYIDLRQTGLTTVVFPKSDLLHTVMIPAVSSVSILGCPKISSFYAEDLSLLTTVNTDSQAVLDFVLDNAPNLQYLTLDRVVYNAASEAKSKKVLNLLLKPMTSATGKVTLNYALTQQEKNALIDKYGNIDLESNQLHVEYTVTSADSITIDGKSNISASYSATYSIVYDGNDLKDIQWAVTGAESYTISENKKSVYVTSRDESGQIGINVVVTRDMNKTPLTANLTVNVMSRVYITGCENEQNFVDYNDESVRVPIKIVPEYYNIDERDVRVTTSDATRCSVLGVNKTVGGDWYAVVNTTFDVNKDGKTHYIPLNVEIDDIEGNIVTATTTVVTTYNTDEYAFTGDASYVKNNTTVAFTPQLSGEFASISTNTKVEVLSASLNQDDGGLITARVSTDGTQVLVTSRRTDSSKYDFTVTAQIRYTYADGSTHEASVSFNNSAAGEAIVVTLEYDISGYLRYVETNPIMIINENDYMSGSVEYIKSDGTTFSGTVKAYSGGELGDDSKVVPEGYTILGIYPSDNGGDKFVVTLNFAAINDNTIIGLTDTIKYRTASNSNFYSIMEFTKMTFSDNNYIPTYNRLTNTIYIPDSNDGRLHYAFFASKLPITVNNTKVQHIGDNVDVLGTPILDEIEYIGNNSSIANLSGNLSEYNRIEHVGDGYTQCYFENGVLPASLKHLGSNFGTSCSTASAFKNITSSGEGELYIKRDTFTNENIESIELGNRILKAADPDSELTNQYDFNATFNTTDSLGWLASLDWINQSDKEKTIDVTYSGETLTKLWSTDAVRSSAGLNATTLKIRGNFQICGTYANDTLKSNLKNVVKSLYLYPTNTDWIGNAQNWFTINNVLTPDMSISSANWIDYLDTLHIEPTTEAAAERLKYIKMDYLCDNLTVHNCPNFTNAIYLINSSTSLNQFNSESIIVGSFDGQNKDESVWGILSKSSAGYVSSHTVKPLASFKSLKLAGTAVGTLPVFDAANLEYFEPSAAHFAPLSTSTDYITGGYANTSTFGVKVISGQIGDATLLPRLGAAANVDGMTIDLNAGLNQRIAESTTGKIKLRDFFNDTSLVGAVTFDMSKVDLSKIEQMYYAWYCRIKNDSANYNILFNTDTKFNQYTKIMSSFVFSNSTIKPSLMKTTMNLDVFEGISFDYLFMTGCKVTSTKPITMFCFINMSDIFKNIYILNDLDLTIKCGEYYNGAFKPHHKYSIYAFNDIIWTDDIHIKLNLEGLSARIKKYYVSDTEAGYTYSAKNGTIELNGSLVGYESYDSFNDIYAMGFYGVYCDKSIVNITGLESKLLPAYFYNVNCNTFNMNCEYTKLTSFNSVYGSSTVYDSTINFKGYIFDCEFLKNVKLWLASQPVFVAQGIKPLYVGYGTSNAGWGESIIKVKDADSVLDLNDVWLINKPNSGAVSHIFADMDVDILKLNLPQLTTISGGAFIRNKAKELHLGLSSCYDLGSNFCGGLPNATLVRGYQGESIGCIYSDPVNKVPYTNSDGTSICSTTLFASCPNLTQVGALDGPLVYFWDGGNTTSTQTISSESMKWFYGDTKLTTIYHVGSGLVPETIVHYESLPDDNDGSQFDYTNVIHEAVGQGTSSGSYANRLTGWKLWGFENDIDASYLR